MSDTNLKKLITDRMAEGETLEDIMAAVADQLNSVAAEIEEEEKAKAEEKSEFEADMQTVADIYNKYIKDSHDYVTSTDIKRIIDMMNFVRDDLSSIFNI